MIVLFDFETTKLAAASGSPLDQQPHAVEFAGVKLDPQTLVEEESLDFLCKPPVKIPYDATKVHGITDDDVKDCAPFKDFIPHLQEFFLGCRLGIAHNLIFDLRILASELLREKMHYQFPWPLARFCTVEQTHYLKGQRLSLSRLYEHCFGKEFEEAHRALPDTRALASCVRVLVENEQIILP